MSMFSKVGLTAVLLMIMAAAYAGTITPQIGGGINQFDGGVASQGTAVQPTGNIVQVDGTSLIFQVDGVSTICRAGGC